MSRPRPIVAQATRTFFAKGLVAIAVAASCGAFSSLARAAEPRAPSLLGPALQGVPTRIVTLAPSLTEMVIALGAQARVVGVSRHDDFPEVEAATRIGGYIDPDLETILGLGPELVIAEPSPGNEDVVRKLASLRIPVRVVHGASMAELRLQIEVLAADLGRREAGRALLARIATRIARVKRALAGTAPVRAMLVVGHAPLVVAGPGSLAHELLELAGATNIVAAGASPYPVYALEALIAADPTLVFDFSGRPSRERAAALSGLSSVRNGRWIALADTRLLRPGPEVVRAVEVMARSLHPDRFPTNTAPPPETKTIAPGATR